MAHGNAMGPLAGDPVCPFLCVDARLREHSKLLGWLGRLEHDLALVLN